MYIKQFVVTVLCYRVIGGELSKLTVENVPNFVANLVPHYIIEWSTKLDRFTLLTVEGLR